MDRTRFNAHHLRLLLSKVSGLSSWRPMRDGNQYIETSHIPTAKLVGASRIDGPRRPWNPHAAIAYGLKAQDHEIVRFIDEEADLIVFLVHNANEIADMQTRIEALENALRPFADAANWYEQRYLDGDLVVENSRQGETARIDVGDLRRAKRALGR